MDLVPPGGEALWNGARETTDGWPTKAYDDDDQPTDDSGAPGYTWTPYPQAGLVLGARFAPPAGQAPFTRQRWRNVPATSTWTPWGAATPDGAARVGRLQTGLRTGALVGLNEDGTTLELLGELWAGWSVWRPRSSQASFLPYHPSLLVGPFARGQWGTVLSEPDGYLPSFPWSRWTVVVGVRGQIRLSQKPDAAEGR